MKKYDSYKDSGIEWIGEIPSHWEERRMRFIGFLFGGISGKSAKDFDQPDNEDNKYYIPFSNIANNFYIDPDYLQTVVVNEDENQNEVQKGDLLFLMSSENYDDIGKSAVVNHELSDTYLNSFCKGFRITDSEVDPIYLNYHLSSKQIRHNLLTTANGFTRINLKVGKVQDLLVCYPPKDEQQVIANFLNLKTSEIDEIIADKNRLLELYEEEKTAIINQAVTKGLDPNVSMKDSGIEWLGEIPEHWEVKKLKYVANLRSGQNIVSEQIIAEGEFPVYGGNGLRGYYSEFTHEGEFVLIGRQGALCGNINYAKDKFWASDHAVVVTPTLNYNTKYLGELLRIMNLNQYSVSAAQPGLSVDRIKSLEIPYPNEEEQQHIVQHIETECSHIDFKKARTEELIELLTEYRTSLISEVVTGKIKVID